MDCKAYSGEVGNKLADDYIYIFFWIHILRFLWYQQYSAQYYLIKVVYSVKTCLVRPERRAVYCTVCEFSILLFTAMPARRKCNFYLIRRNRKMLSSASKIYSRPTAGVVSLSFAIG